MSYWTIRKRRKLQSLPPLPVDPIIGETTRAGASENDERYRRSVLWMERYNRQKKDFLNGKTIEESDREIDEEENASADRVGEAPRDGEREAPGEASAGKTGEEAVEDHNTPAEDHDSRGVEIEKASDEGNGSVVYDGGTPF